MIYWQCAAGLGHLLGALGDTGRFHVQTKIMGLYRKDRLEESAGELTRAAPEFQDRAGMLEVGVFHQIVERRILVESLSVLPGPEAIVEPTGVIRRELGSHVPRSSRVADRRGRPHATGSRLGAISTLCLTDRGPGSQDAVSRSVRITDGRRAMRWPPDLGGSGENGIDHVL